MTTSVATSGMPGVGVFGSGQATRILLPLISKQGFKVVALWSSNQEEATLLARESGVPYATNRVDNVLLRKDVHLVLILCDPVHHSQIAVKALGIGKHTIVQCPGGLTQDETLRMVQAAQYYPRLTSVLTCGLRFHPVFETMKKVIQTGYVGNKVCFCDVRLDMRSIVGGGSNYSWRCDSIMGGGVFNLFGSHIIDLLCYLTDRKCVRACGTLNTFRTYSHNINGIRRITSDDHVIFQLEFADQIMAVINISGLQGNGGTFRQEVVVTGQEGYLIVRGSNLYGQKQSNNNDEEANNDSEQVLYEEDKFSSSNSDLMMEETMQKKHHHDPLLPQLYLTGLSHLFGRLACEFVPNNTDKESFSARSSSIGTTFTSFNDAHHIQAVIEAVRVSNREKRWIKVQPATRQGKVEA